MARRFPNLSNWASAPDGPVGTSLGKLDPSNFTLMMCSYVGNRHRTFNITDDYLAYGVNVLENCIGNYKILTLYTFYNCPSIDHGSRRFYFTLDPDTLENKDDIRSNSFVMEGFDDFEVLEDFFRAETELRREYFQLTGLWMLDRCSNGIIT